MALRTITWTVDKKFNVTPSTTQDGGIQGEDKATEVVFELPDDPKEIHYHIEYTGSVYDVTEALTADTETVGEKTKWKIKFLLPRAWTQGGGAATLRLVGEVDGVVVYSVEGRIRYRDRKMAAELEQTLLKGTVMQAVAAAETAAAEAGKSAGDAGAAADAAAKSATDAKTAEAAAEAAVGQAAVQVELAEEARDETERFKNAAAGDYAQYKQSLSALQEGAAAKAVDAAEWANKAELQAKAAAASAADALSYKQGVEGVMHSVNNMASEASDAKDEASDAKDEAVAAKNLVVEYTDYASKSWETAANTMVEAQTAAETAKSGAETAQTAAEAAAENATALVAEADAALLEAQTATAEMKRQAANAITADRRGGAVRVDDLSPLEHPYTVTVEGVNLVTPPQLSDVTVHKHGKNLLPSSYYLTSSVVNGVTVTVNEDGTLILNGTAEKFTTLYLVHSSAPLILPKGVKVSLSGVPAELAPATAHDCYITLRTPGNEQTITDYGAGNCMVTEYAEYECRLYFKGGGVMNNVVLRPQIEIGEETAWASPIDHTTHTVTADGLVEGVELVAGEDATLFTDTADTVVRCVYNRDTNKVIEELVNAIISLGGNV